MIEANILTGHKGILYIEVFIFTQAFITLQSTWTEALSFMYSVDI